MSTCVAMIKRANLADGFLGEDSLDLWKQECGGGSSDRDPCNDGLDHGNRDPRKGDSTTPKAHSCHSTAAQQGGSRVRASLAPQTSPTDMRRPVAVGGWVLEAAVPAGRAHMVNGSRILCLPTYTRARRGVQSVAGALRDIVEQAGAPSASSGSILFGASSSSRANKVQWAAAEADIEFAHVSTATAELKENDAYRILNPKGTVPTWVECDLPVPFVLNESNSIVAHIAAHSSLGPRDRYAHSLAWQWQEYGESSLQPAGSPVWWGVKYGSGYPLGPGSALVPLDEAKLEAAIQKAIRAWQVVDDHLADGRPFMLGSELTFGDITCGVHANRLFQMGEAGPQGRFDMKHLRAWYDRLRERPAYMTAVVQPTMKP